MYAPMCYDWSGNVRGLRNVLQRYVTLGNLEFLAPTSRNESRTTSATSNINLSEAIQDLEKSLITQALRQADGNRTQAAALLGISRRSLFRKMPKP